MKQKKKEKTHTKDNESKPLKDELWLALDRKYRSGETIRGSIATKVTGGFNVRVDNVVGLLPREHFSGAHGLLANYQGQQIDVKIIKLTRRPFTLVLSHDLVTNPMKLKPEPRREQKKTSSRPVVVEPECRRCHDLLGRDKRYEGLCYVCYCKRHKAPVVRSMVQGGNPGLKKKQTVRIGRTKRGRV